MLGISFASIRLEWSEDFEYFLMERKKRRKVRDPVTLKYYKTLFMKYLQGRELSEERTNRLRGKLSKQVTTQHLQTLHPIPVL